MQEKRLIKKIQKLIPGAQIEEDNFGQIVIYTGMKSVGPNSDIRKGTIVPMQPSDFEE